MIKVEHVSCGYRNKTILKEVSFSLDSGTLLFLLGQNGTGKTTLIKTILHLLHPSSGSVWVNGNRLYTMSPMERSRLLSYVPQSFATAFPLTVLEAVLMGRSPYIPHGCMPTKDDIDIAEKSLESTGIIKLRHRDMATLSGGEKRLVLIARAIAQQTEYILMDEPVSELDMPNTEKIFAILAELTACGKGILCSCHDPHYAYNLNADVLTVQGDTVKQLGNSREKLSPYQLEKTYGIHLAIEQLKNNNWAVYPERIPAAIKKSGAIHP